MGSDLESPGRARAVVRAVLQERAWPADRIEDACLVVTELIANAVTHGDGLISLTSCWDNGRVRFEAADRSTAMPARQDPSLLVAGRRGLRLIDALADAWGATLTIGGPARKRVWCVLSPTGPCS